MSRLAALGGDGVWIEGAQRPQLLELAGITVERLLAGMRRAGVDVLYVHGSALEGLGLPAGLEVPRPGEHRPAHPFVEGVTFEGERVNRRALAPSIECGGLEVLIGAYQDGAGCPFEPARDARELRDAAAAFRDAFATPRRPRGWMFRHSAIATGWKLMHQPWRHGQRAARLTGAMDAPELLELEGVDGAPQVEVPYGSWCVSEDVAHAAGGAQPAYLAGWDVNGQRLAACARLSLGVGPVTEREPAAFDKRLPGYHLIASVSNRHEGLIPPIFAPGWHTTPRVAMAQYLELEPVIERSIVWERHVPYLNPWYEQLRDARAHLLELASAAWSPGSPVPRAAAIALGALKQTYLQPLGRLRSTRARESNSPLYRPSWYDHVIGQELAREHLRLVELAELRVPIVAVYFDTIIAATDDPSTPPPALEVSPQLGKYKPLGALPGEQARGILYGEGAPQVGELVKALKAAGVPDEAPAPPPGASAAPAALSALARPAHGGYPGVPA